MLEVGKRKRPEEVFVGCEKQKVTRKGPREGHWLFLLRQNNRGFLTQFLATLSPWDLACWVAPARHGDYGILRENNLFWYLAAKKNMDDLGDQNPIVNYRELLVRYWRRDYK